MALAGALMSLVGTLVVISCAARRDTAVAFDLHPTEAQRAAVRRAASADFADVRKVAGRSLEYAVGEADLNEDGRPDLLVQYLDAYFCGSAGCSTILVMATPRGYAPDASRLPVQLPPGAGLTVLGTSHLGMRDLRYASGYVSRWSGHAYQ